MNNLIRVSNEKTSMFVTCPVETTHMMLEMFEKAPNKVDVEVFKVGKMPFEKLPEEIQAEVKNTLKVFSRCNVYYENREFHASTGCCIRSHYGFDHFVCGEYLAKEIYTEEERRQNDFEAFG